MMESIFNAIAAEGSVPCSLEAGTPAPFEKSACLIPPSSHDITEICINCSGTSLISGDTGNMVLNKYDTCVLFPGTVHSECVAPGIKAFSDIWLIFGDPIHISQTHYSAQPESFKCSKMAIVEWTPKLRSVHNEFIEAMLEKKNPLIIKGLWHQMLGYLVECPKAGKGEKTSHLARMVHFTVARIQDAPAKEWTVKALAEMIGWTENHYSFRFRQVMGVSPVQYLIRYRLKKASEILTSSALRISEVAYSVGFSSMNYFSRRFRQAYGIVPREYREKYGK